MKRGDQKENQNLLESKCNKGCCDCSLNTETFNDQILTTGGSSGSLSRELGWTGVDFRGASGLLPPKKLGSKLVAGDLQGYL